MDDIKKRLQTAADNCLKNYDAWDSDKKKTSNREDLQEAIHELRKVASRLEIEIAVSERDAMSDKPLPIPHHRSTTKAKGPVESILPDDGNTNPGNNSGKKEAAPRRPRRRTVTKNN